MKNKLPTYWVPIFEFLLFFGLSALLLFGADIIYFLVSHRKPMMSENIGCLVVFSVIWIIGGLRCHILSEIEGLQRLSFKQEQTTTQPLA